MITYYATTVSADTVHWRRCLMYSANDFYAMVKDEPFPCAVWTSPVRQRNPSHCCYNNCSNISPIYHLHSIRVELLDGRGLTDSVNWIRLTDGTPCQATSPQRFDPQKQTRTATKKPIDIQRHFLCDSYMRAIRSGI